MDGASSVTAVLGLLACALSLIGPTPYVRDVLHGTTRPHRGTWFIWTVLGTTALAAQWAHQPGWPLAMMAAQAVTITAVFLLSLRYGVGGPSASDLVLIGLAGLGVLGWALSARPVVASCFIVAADLIGVLLMVPKTWRDPWSETASSFAVAGVAGGLGAAAAGSLAPAVLLYPSYFAVVNAALAMLIVARRRSVTILPAPRSLEVVAR
jgi:hypothetical protein